MESRSSNACGVTSTRKAMFPSKSPFGLFEWNGLTTLGLFSAAADGSNGLCTFEAVEHELIALGILHDECGPAIYSQNERSLLFLEVPHILLDVALEVTERVSLRSIVANPNHAVSIQFHAFTAVDLELRCKDADLSRQRTQAVA